MKKALLLSLVFILALAGCSSTFPALKDAWINGVITDSSESKTIIKVDVETKDERINDEIGQILVGLLKLGIIIEQKTTKDQNYYLKIGFVDPAPIKNSEYWKSDSDPYVEVFVKGSDIYARTSSEERLIRVEQSDAELMNDLSAGAMFTNKEIADLKQFFTGELKKYVSQFDFKLRKIEDRGFTNYTTPEGTQSVKQIHVELTIDDIIAFAAYLLGNLAEYDGLKPLYQEFANKILKEKSEMKSDEEIDAAIADFRETLLEAKAMLEQYDEQKIEEQFGLDIDYLLQTDMYITTDAKTIGTNMLLDLNVKNAFIGDLAKIKLSVDTQRWNIDKEVYLPDADFGNALTITDLDDREKIKQLGEQSVVRLIAEENLRRKGHLTIGDELAQVKNKYVFLQEAPYVTKSGNTMVPVHIISDIAETEAKWDGETKEVTFTIDGNEVLLKIGSMSAFVNGEQFAMPEAAVIKSGRTFVPLQFVTEKLGAKVKWEPETQSIEIEFE